MFKLPEKFTIGSCDAKAANLFFAHLNGNLVILDISLIIFLSNFFVLIPVPTAVHLELNNKFLLSLI